MNIFQNSIVAWMNLKISLYIFIAQSIALDKDVFILEYIAC